ncbi:MAG TPA: adenylate/guanylate cyclase domain-containing protein [Chitinophagaceae bacterium]|nr:adenylate/guanylate cyclase domain-containing protein [Chitinophagaceae bacterium]
MRQLAAILFADMTGYTALMQENEQLAISKRQRLKSVLETSVVQHGGRILQFYGDGSLSIFGSAIDGVRSAISMQQQLQAEPKVAVRMGLHTGDVYMEEETIYGDGVNLASRIESLAVPGSVFVSEKVFDDIRNQEGISVREMGYFELKNVQQPVRIFAIANDGLVIPSREAVQGKTAQPSNRLAVLPFVNMSADTENEYFSDGITEELLNALTKVEGLQVTSRTSAFAYKGKNDDVREIGIRLNVDKILEGSVRKAGNRVRITAQLINAADGYHIWSENYDRNLTDIFELQDEISGIIANKLRENLGTKAKEIPLVKAPVKNLTAYTCYLKSLHYRNKITPADDRKCIACCEEAIALEPGYAQAYAMAAMAYGHLGSLGQMQPKEAFDIVHRYADKALKLDDTLAEGYIAKGSAFLHYDWNFVEAKKALEKAITINPAAIDAYQPLAFYYIVIGQKEKALEVMEKAVKLDPLSTVLNYFLGNVYLFNERYDEALKQAEGLLEREPHMRSALELKGWATGLKGNWQEALVHFQEVHRLTGHPLKGLLPLGYAHAMLGQREEALECIRKLEKRAVEDPNAIVDSDLAGIWNALGEYDKVFYYIEQCIQKRIGPVGFFLEYPAFKELRKDPRFEQLGIKAGWK